jgi:hypothetical protein
MFIYGPLARAHARAHIHNRLAQMWQRIFNRALMNTDQRGEGEINDADN